jgi:hypothetical protein
MDQRPHIVVVEDEATQRQLPLQRDRLLESIAHRED